LLLLSVCLALGTRRELHARWTTPALARLWCRASGAAPSYCCVCCCACCFKPAKRRRCRCSLSPGTAGSSAAAACSPAHRELLYVSQRLALRADHPAPSTAASKATQLTALSPWPKNQGSELHPRTSIPADPRYKFFKSVQVLQISMVNF